MENELKQAQDRINQMKVEKLKLDQSVKVSISTACSLFSALSYAVYSIHVSTIVTVSLRLAYLEALSTVPIALVLLHYISFLHFFDVLNVYSSSSLFLFHSPLPAMLLLLLLFMFRHVSPAHLTGAGAASAPHRDGVLRAPRAAPAKPWARRRRSSGRGSRGAC